MPYFIKRLVSMLAGLAIESFGIALITKSNLGTSPISSIAWVVTLRFPWISFGVTTFVMNAIFVAIEVILLRRDFKPVQYLQLAVTFWFAATLDVSMMLLTWFSPTEWWLRGIGLLLGTALLAFGICMEVSPKLIMVPGEGIVRAFSMVTKVRFGTVKVCFDISLIVIAGVLSFLFFGRLNGLGIGTIIAAAITGLIVNFFNRHIRFVSAVEPANR
ncbi:YczE/YyaS/YitT family protein [Bifidobacterium miconisargentati]|uniref:YczE/YyaS/YitT family protein n=1 Tax=Bifidobacterium miconisargentati TaxID=2834437 RepID=UPI001BDCFEFF|nr:DUF6198 family protein [Bifidobacterium miconisargentati]MBW3090559.1 YitT family protein [Bifidobacterium miconisargentati]